jgi:predicted N-acetyltransferase YhbS
LFFSGKSMIRIRPSRPGEEDSLAATAHDAFRVMEPAAWQAYYREHTARAAEDTLIAEEDGRILGHATALRLSLRRAGAELPFRGIAAVAVVPEARRRGVAERLMTAHHQAMRRRREPLALLFPFSTGFYRKLGYGVVEWVDVVRASPRQLPDSPLRARVRKLDRDADLAEVQRVYQAARDPSHGLLARDAWWWQQRVLARAPDRVGVHGEDGKLEGYALYEVAKEPARLGAMHLRIKELQALSPEAWRALLGYFAALGDQFGLVELVLPRGAGATLLETSGLVDAPDAGPYHAVVLEAAGAMARVVDVAGAQALLAPKTRGRVGLDVDDPTLGQLRHEPRLRSRLALAADQLAQILLGAASARALLERGQIAGDRRAAELLDEASPTGPLHLGRLNFF